MGSWREIGLPDSSRRNALPGTRIRRRVASLRHARNVGCMLGCWLSQRAADQRCGVPMSAGQIRSNHAARRFAWSIALA
jgi:hypothetical protein